MDAVAESGFFEVPSGNKSAVSDADTRDWTRFEANWKGRHRAVELPDRTMPKGLQEALSKFFPISIIRDSQPTPPFWADDDAVLWLSEGRRCESTTGLILYRSGKVAMFGWNYLAMDTSFQTFSTEIDRRMLQEIFDGFEQAKVDPEFRIKYQSRSINLEFPGGGAGHVLIYKPNPNAFVGIPETTWSRLRGIRDEMKSRLRGPNLPERIEHCRKNPPR